MFSLRFRSSFFLLAAAMLACTAAAAQVFIHRGGKLVGAGSTGPAQQGTSVALSGDGNTALIGAPLDNGEIGAAWVFIRDTNGNWSQQGSKLVGNGALGTANQGWSVALSADGDTALVGGTGDDSHSGAVWVFTRDRDGNWSQQGNKLVGTGTICGEDCGVYQGNSVALSADGNTALEGGPGDSGGLGAAWVFTRDTNGNWTQQGNKLGGIDAAGAAGEGASVALSGDGNTALESGPGDNDFMGAAWVFRRHSDGKWTQQGKKLVGSGAVGIANQGDSVALSSDGNTVLVGGPYDNGTLFGSAVGAIWVFERNSDNDWSQQGSKLVGTGAVGLANQGFSVAISSDRNTALVDGPFDNGRAGGVWVFTRNRAGVWRQLESKVVSPGRAIAISADGNTAIVGDAGYGDEVGAAWPFVRPPGGP